MPSHPVTTLRSRLFWLAIIVLLAVAPDPARAMPGDIYVSTCCDANEIDRVTLGGSVTVFATSGSDRLWDLAFDSAGNLFAVNSSNNTIEKFAPDGVSTVFASTSAKTLVGGLAFDAAGNLFASFSNNTIEKYTPNGVGTVFATTGLNAPQGLAFNASGDLFVANTGNNTIEKFTSSGIASVFASRVFGYPWYSLPSLLAFDPSGNLFVGDYFVSTIFRFTPSGMESLFATVPDDVEVQGLAFDNAGDLLVADSVYGVLAVAQNGDQRTIATGLSVVIGLAVEPAVSSVSEPSTALILAIAVVGLRLTRRRQRPC